MPYVRPYRVAETSTTTGAGSITLAGAVTGYASFASVLANADTATIVIEAVNAGGLPTGEWEICETAFTSPSTLTRGTLVASSTGSRVSFAAGTKRVFAITPADAVDLASDRLIGSLPAAKVSGLPAGLSSLGVFSSAAVAATPVALPNLYFAGVQAEYPSSSRVSSPSVVFAGGTVNLFAACENSSRVLTSPDGVTWTLRTNTIGGNRIAWDGTRVITLAANSTSVSRSTDAISYTTSTALPTACQDVAALTNGTALFIDGGTPAFYTTTNGGVSYTTQTPPAAPNGDASGKSIYAVGTRFVFRNGANLYHSTTGAGGSWTTLAIAGELGGTNGIVAQEPDGCLIILSQLSTSMGTFVRLIRLNTDMTFTTIADLPGQGNGTVNVSSSTRAIRFGSATVISSNGQTWINGVNGRYLIGDLPSSGEAGTFTPGFLNCWVNWAQSATRIVGVGQNSSTRATNYAISYPIAGPTGLYQA